MPPHQNRPRPSLWRILPLFVLFTALSISAHAQSPFYRLSIGLRGGLKSDFHSFDSDRTLIKPAFRRNPSTGWIQLSYNFNESWRLELGVGASTEILSYKIPQTKFQLLTGTTVYKSISLQGTMARSFPIIPKRLLLAPSLGIITFLSEGRRKSSFTVTNQLKGSGGYLTTYIETIEPNTTYAHLGLKARIPLELVMRSGIRLSLAPAASIHPIRIGQPTQTTLSYGLNGQLTHTSKVSPTSYSTEFVLGLDYPISRIWEGRKELIP